MAEKVVLALDLGTTGNRVIAFTKDGRIAAKSYYEFTQIFPKSGWVEHDPSEILRTTLKALKNVTDQIGISNVVSIGITNQRETTIIWNKNTGQPVYNAIVWQCRRTEKICQRLKKHEPSIKQKTGLFLDPYFSGTKIKWILENVPGVKSSAQKGEILFGTVDTWILWNLTGRKVHATDPSNASRTLIFNIRKLEFDRQILKLMRIPPQILPEVLDSNAHFGVTDKELVGREIPITGILGDQQAALFAHGGTRKGLIKSTYGTGIFILMNTADRMVSTKHLLTTIAYKMGNELAYAVEGSLFMGGASIQWLRDNLMILSSSAESEAMAAKTIDNDGVYFVPAFQGLGSPYWDPNARGLLIGLSRKSARENVIRAVLESMAYQVRDVLEEIKKSFKGKLKILSVDGGACTNNLLMQFQSDILGLRIDRPNISEITAFGAAGMSGFGSGFWTISEFQSLCKLDRSFMPTMPRKNANSFYSKWKEAVQRSRNWAS